MRENLSHRTAIRRKSMSAPAVWLHNEGRIVGPVLDFGCGHGADVRGLQNNGYQAIGYDPRWAPTTPRQGAFRTVLCTFVLNVIEDYSERIGVLDRIAYHLAPEGLAYVTVRRDLDGTGWTSKGTWQGMIDLRCTGKSVLHRKGAFEVYELTADDCRTALPLIDAQVYDTATHNEEDK